MRRYPGPIAFSTDQEKLFFGRDDDIKELSELIFVERKVLLYSKSGYGKSSLLNAGVEPRLKENKGFEFVKIRFYDGSNSTLTPNDRFLTTVKQNADFVKTENQRTLIDIYAKDYLNEYWSVFKKNQMAGNDNKTYILIFDQFEELFSYPTEQINEFKNRLADILSVNRPPHFFTTFEEEIFRDKRSIDNTQLDQLYQPVNIKVVFSIRSDRLSELNVLADKIPDIQKVFYELKPLSDEQLRDAVKIPANKPGKYDSTPFTFTPEAIDKIISALTLEGEKTVSTTTLQIICQRIEGDFIPKEDGGKDFILKNNTDNIIEAEELPDFKDIFLDFYNCAVTRVKTDTPETVRKFIEDELIKEGRRISLDQALCNHVRKDTLETLVNTKLINVERNSVGSFSYELGHDTFIPSINEMKDQRIKDEEDKRIEAERQEELRIAKEKAKKERIEHEKEARQQAELLTLEQARAAEAERAAHLAGENYKNQLVAASKQRKLMYLAMIVALIAIATAGSTVFLGIIAKNNMNKAKGNLSKYLETDANKLYNEENFKAARSGYERLRDEDLLKYTDKPDSVLKQIEHCFHNDSIKPLFDLKFILADSLTNVNTLDDLITANGLINELEKMNYKPAKDKLETLRTDHSEKAKMKVANTIIRINEYLAFPDNLYFPEAKNMLLKLQKLDSTDQRIIDLRKRVQ